MLKLQEHRTCITMLCFVLVLLLPLLTSSASAESLRCGGQITGEGDSKLSLLYKCGEPMLRDSFCAPLYFNGTLQVAPPPFYGTTLPCQVVEEWLYDRGPGTLLATVRIRDGVVQSISYGGRARAP